MNYWSSHLHKRSFDLTKFPHRKISFCNTANCVADTNECLQNGINPCGHDALCINTESSFICQCVNGWTGTLCTEGTLYFWGVMYTRRWLNCIKYCTIKSKSNTYTYKRGVREVWGLLLYFVLNSSFACIFYTSKFSFLIHIYISWLNYSILTYNVTF